MNIPKIILSSIAFITGAALMGIEIVGARMISLHMGSSIFVWGSVISVVMGSLSVGYFLGGRFADRYPDPKVLTFAISLTALWIIPVPFFINEICAWTIGLQIGIRFEPFLPALLSLALPSVILGSVTPFVVRLTTTALDRVGQSAGFVYGISTVGSIVGTIVTSFYFITAPALGSTATLWLWSGALLVCALLSALYGASKKHKWPLSALIAIGLSASATLAIASPHFKTLHNQFQSLIQPSLIQDIPQSMSTESYRYLQPERIIDSRESPYHDITIVEKYICQSYKAHSTQPPSDIASLSACKQGSCQECEEDSLFRTMRFGNYTETAIQASHPELIAVPDFYTESFYIPLIWAPNPQNVIIIGSGGGIGPRMFLQDFQDSHVSVVEIDPEVIHLAHNYFDLPENHPRLSIYHDDGRAFFYRKGRTTQSQSKADIVILDAFSGGGRPPFHLMTKEYLELIASNLSQDGVCMSNIISALSGEGSALFHAQLKTYSSVFRYVYVFPFVRYRYYKNNLSTQKTKRRNIFILGTNKLLPNQEENRPESSYQLIRYMHDRLYRLINNKSQWVPTGNRFQNNSVKNNQKEYENNITANKESNIIYSVTKSLSYDEWSTRKSYKNASILKDNIAPVTKLHANDLYWSKR